MSRRAARRRARWRPSRWRAARRGAPPTGSSASRTCRSRAGCSPGPRRSCSSCRSSGSRCCGRGRGWSTRASAASLRVPGARRGRCAGALGVAAFAFVRLRRVRRHAVGDREPRCRPSIYVVFWVGIPFASLLFGDVFARVQPVAGGRRGRRRWARGARARRDCPTPLAYPERLGRWPAALGILAFAWVELVYANRDDPSLLAVLALAYAAVQLVGMSLYGIEAWTRNADAFGVYFGLFAPPVAAALARRAPGLRPPLAGVAAIVAGRRHRRRCCASMIGTTSFDGFSQGAMWTGTDGIAPAPAAALRRPRPQRRARRWRSPFTVGLLAMVLLVARRSTGSASRACARSAAAHTAARAGAARSRTRWSRSRSPTSSPTTSRCSSTRARRWPT